MGREKETYEIIHNPKILNELRGTYLQNPYYKEGTMSKVILLSFRFINLIQTKRVLDDINMSLDTKHDLKS